MKPKHKATRRGRRSCSCNRICASFAAAFFLLVATVRAADEKSEPSIQVEELHSPSGPNALGASIAISPDGTLWLSWVEAAAASAPMASPVAARGVHPAGSEPAAGHQHATAPAAVLVDAPPNTLRFSTFDPAGKKWRPARTIAAGHGVTTSSADFPQLVIDGRGNIFAVWTDGHGGALLSQSSDHGATWSTPAPWSRESTAVEKFSFVTLADGRVMAAWLDGGRKKSPADSQQLYTRIFGQPLATSAKQEGSPPDVSAPDTLVDASVCDCCQTTLTAFPDGGALLAYRGRTANEVRDILTARFRGKAWDTPRRLHPDEWRIAACPVNGPQLASDGGRVAAAWFTAAGDDPRVLTSLSPDAGARFLLPLRVDRGHPTGHVDTLILHDGAMLVTWLENDGSVWLRRISPDFTANEPVQLAAAKSTSIKTVPRVALLRDYAGGKTSAQLIAAFASEGTPAALRSILVSVPESELVEAEKNCDCEPTAGQLQGFPIRGTIVQALTKSSVLRVSQAELPGIFADGTHDFKVAPEVLVTAQAGRQFLGRIERRDAEWWLLEVKLFSAPVP